MFTRISKNQSGFILIYVTLTLVVAIIILPALLLFIGGAGRSAQIREDRMLQVYAADAGIEKAFHEIIIHSPNPPANPNDAAWVGNITGNVTGTIYGFNENFVDIKVYKEGTESGVYRILSTATNWEGISTTIECYTAVQDSRTLFDNALTSFGNITLKQGVGIDGNITLNGDKIGQGWDEDNLKQVRDEGITYWPNEEDLKAYYQQDTGNCIVPKVTPFPDEDLDVSDDPPSWPLLRCGDLNLFSSENYATITLGNTTYVTGNFNIPPSTNEFYLDLGNQTIFCEGNINISGKCHIIGNGCIIALGNVNFTPKFGTESGKFVFILSVNGWLNIQPSGSFYGSLAAYEYIIIKKGQDIGDDDLWVEWVDYQNFGFLPNFPTEDEVKLPAIITYTILD